MYCKKVLFVFLLLFFPLFAFSCDLCGCFVPAGALIRGLQVGLTEQYSSLSDLSFEGQSVTNSDDQFVNSSNLQLFANYHFNEHVALQVNIPVIHRSFQRMNGETMESGHESGLGDTLLVGYYVPFQRKNPYSQFHLKLIGGLKFPTGNSDRLEEDRMMMEEGMMEDDSMAVHGSDLALGSGSWDGLVGANVFGRVDRWYYTGNVQYSIRTRGSFGYRYADDLVWYGGPGYYVTSSKEWPVGLQALLIGEHKGDDDIDGEAMAMAITAVYLGPTAMIGVKQLGTAEIGIGFPLSIHNSGLQTVSRYRIRMGFTWRL